MAAQDIEFDEFSDPENPHKIKFDDIVAATKRLSGHIELTPCLRAHMSSKLGMELYLKVESIHRTGSFKERGVLNALAQLDVDQKRAGVIAASIGNYGIALSCISTRLGIPCIVVMPANSPASKITKAQQYGAKVLLHGTNIQDATTQAMLLKREKKMICIKPCASALIETTYTGSHQKLGVLFVVATSNLDHPNVIEGNGTVGLEILDQTQGLDAILVPVGAGTLITGIATIIKKLRPNMLVYGVSTDKTCCMSESLKKNERIYFTVESTLADGLSLSTVGVNAFHSLKGLVDRLIIVQEDWVARAIMHLLEDERLVVEGAGAVTFAAVMAGSFPNLRGKRVACVISGGNIDNVMLIRAVERGFGAEGRLVKFRVTVQDRLGSTAEICSVLASVGASIRDCTPQHSWMNGDVFSVEMIIVVETKGWNHSREVMEEVKKNFKNSYFLGMEEQPASLSITCRGPCMPQPQTLFGL